MEYLLKRGVFTLSLSLCFLSVADARTVTIKESDVEPLMQAVSIVHHYYYKKVPFKLLFKDAARGMLEELDPHSSIMTAKESKALESSMSGKFVGIGVELVPEKSGLRVISPFDDSPAEKAGVKAGDMILEIDGRPIHQANLDRVIGLIRGKPGTSVRLTILHKGAKESTELVIVRERIKYKAVKSEPILDHYGYVRISAFQESVAKNLAKAVRKLKKKQSPMKGLVLDMRSNPGGLLTSAVDVSNVFLTPNKLKRYGKAVVSIKGRVPDSNEVFRVRGSQLLKGIPVVVLINGGSASAAEIVAGALQDYNRALIVGTRSFGKGSVQTIIPAADGINIKLTTALYYTPSGKQIQARGIIPDVYAPALSIKKESSEPYFRYGEAELDNHVQNHGTSNSEKLREKEAARHDALLELAEKDSQLYEAVALLEAQSKRF